MSPGRNHVPGYAGHIPGLDMGSTCTFGQSTTQNLLDSASKITPSGSATMQIKHMSTKDVPRERGAPRPHSIEPPAKSAQVGSPGYATEGLNRRPPAGACRLFLGPGFRLGAR